MLTLEGSAPHAGAALIQARANFFARTDAYPVSHVLVAEREGAVIGVECLALTEVRVGGVACTAGYSFNTRVQPGLQRRGLGPAMLEAAERWAEGQGAGYMTGFIKASNDRDPHLWVSGWPPSRPTSSCCAPSKRSS
ncbi:MAG: GNAT family N-acetyltransferase, partial [Candidatus Methylomirabilales bacterium]